MRENDLAVLEEGVRLRRAGIPHALVTVVAARGSTPQDIGAKMLVATTGRVAGTVGGGKVEAAAIDHAKKLLEQNGGPHILTWNLQRDLGMTCGGEMTLFFEPHAGGAGWTIALFGAGHVAQALARVLAPLDCRLLCFDARAEWLAQFPAAGNLAARHSDDLATEVDALPEGAFVLAITQGHATDLPVLKRALARNFSFVGAIGSRSKRAALERELREAGAAPERIAALRCPLGLPIGTNHPQEIAISIAAELIQARDAQFSA